MKIYFAPDKIKHFVVGLVISAITVILGYGLLYAFLATLIAGVGKEIFDWLYTKYYKPKVFHFELMDIVATLLGFIPVLLIHLSLLIWL